jgi:hypoxanthine phosphoribosyltransferase
MNVGAKPQISLAEVEQRLRALPLPDVEAVVAIERGGLAPAQIAASILQRSLFKLRVSYRDDSNEPMFEEPRLVARSQIPCASGADVLLVDDVSVTGATMERARRELSSLTVTTLVLKGSADHVAFPEIQGCVAWPWSPDGTPDPPP